MHNKKLFLVSVICAVFICGSWLLGVELYSLHETSAYITPPAAAAYTVREYNGKIAVFVQDHTTPLDILPDPYVRDLPQADQAMLKKGIALQSEAELQSLLEDLSS